MRWFFASYDYEPRLRPDSGGFRKTWELGWAMHRRGDVARVFFPRLPGFAPLREVPSESYAVVDRPVLRPVSAYLSMWRTVARAARREAGPILYMRSHLSPLPPYLARRFGGPLVLEVNADAVESLRRDGRRRGKAALYQVVEGANLRAADVVVALTPGLRRTVVERYGIDEAKVHVVPSGTDPDHFAPADPAASRCRIGVDPGRRVIGFVGLFYRHQGVATLIEAMAALRTRQPRALALVVGDGAPREAWQALARRLGVDDVVRFTGQVPYTEVPTYLGAMDVVVAPFTADRGETSPFKVLDALASARPVIASDLPSVRSLADETDAVSLVAPEDPRALADRLDEFLQHPERSAARGRHGREFVVARHSWARIAALTAACVGAKESGARW
jgi:glycosyltransferase involved in cell wall biosynthesis